MTIDSIASAGPSRALDRPLIGAEPAAAPGAARTQATKLDTKDAVKNAAAPPSLDQVKEAVTQLNQNLQAKSQSLEFSIDTESKRTVVKLIDQTTKEVLRQYPSEALLELSKSLEAASGQLIKQTA